jgi:hypothetical protein
MKKFILLIKMVVRSINLCNIITVWNYDVVVASYSSAY